MTSHERITRDGHLALAGSNDECAGSARVSWNVDYFWSPRKICEDVPAIEERGGGYF